MSESRRVPDEKAGNLRRLSATDAMFLYGETFSMPMHTMGTLILDPSDVPGRFGFEEIAETVSSRIHLMTPFRQRLLEIPLGLGHPVMVDDPDFRIENHLHRLAAPAPGGVRELAEIVAELAGRLLDRHQPLWEMWVVEGMEGGRIAVVAKLHHCMMDGASGSSQMASFMDLEPDPGPIDAPQEWSPPPLPGALSLATSSVGSRFIRPSRLARLLFDTGKGLRSRRRAEAEVERSGDPRPGMLDFAPAVPFSRAVTPHRAVAFGSAPLDSVKHVKNVFGGTVNDVVLAAGTLALRSYLEERNALPDEPLICVVPVSLKADPETGEFSNRVTTISIRLPTHLSDPEAVLRAVHRETEDAKYVFHAVSEDIVARWLEIVPPSLFASGAQAFSEFDLADRMPLMMNLAISNMKGPPIPLYFGGARVEAVYPMGPIGEGMGLNLTVLSNMGRLDLGVLSCRELVPDPWEVAEGFTRCIRDLELLAEKTEARREGGLA